MPQKLKQKHIEDFLQDIPQFSFGQKSKLTLQQHRTPPDLAAKLLFHIHQHQPIEQYTVADIGVGTGMLLCGAVFIGAGYVIGMEVDGDYIEQTRQMLEQKVEGGDYELVNADARSVRFRPGMVDLVIMNPPFGTKEAGIDMVFLELAMSICTGNIYSMHKSSTRKFVGKYCEERGYEMEVLMEVKFPLKKRFTGYHKKEVGFTEVDVIVVRPGKELLEARTRAGREGVSKDGEKQAEKGEKQGENEEKVEQGQLEKQVAGLRVGQAEDAE